MFAIGFGVKHIVDDVDRTGGQAKSRHRQSHPRDLRRVGQGVVPQLSQGEQQRRSHKDILDPLVRAQGGDQRRQGHEPVLENLLVEAQGPQFLPTSIGADNHILLFLIRTTLFPFVDYVDTPHRSVPVQRIGLDAVVPLHPP